MNIAALLSLLAVIRSALPQTICNSQLLVVTSSPGVVTSDGYPGRYPAETDCTCELRGASGIVVQISFNDFQVDSFPGSLSGAPGTCTHHYLEVYNGVDLSAANLLGSFCGTRLPPVLISSGAALTLRFVTSPYSLNNRYRGFSINYTALAETQGQDPSIQTVMMVTDSHSNLGSLDSGCWSMRRLTAPGGSIVSPGFPTSYPANLACTWEIVASSESTIMLQFLTFLVGGTAAICENNVNDYVIVYTGTGQNKVSQGTYCGWELPQFTDLGSEVTIELVTNNVGGFRGFFVTYTVVGPTTTTEPPPTTVPPPVIITTNTPQSPATPAPVVDNAATRPGRKLHIMALLLLVAILTPAAR